MMQCDAMRCYAMLCDALRLSQLRANNVVWRASVCAPDLD